MAELKNQGLGSSRQAESHLLVTAFVTPKGLTSYKLGDIDSASTNFRLGRFLTSLASMATFEWKTTTFFVEIDETYGAESDHVYDFILEYFPLARVERYRLESPKDWREALSHFHDDDWILLNANDDHAIVPNGKEELKLLIPRMKASGARIGLVTHFGEFSGLLEREILKRRIQGKPRLSARALEMDFVIGTVLVNSRFAKTWFRRGALPEGLRIVRPDNPFGESIRFSLTLAQLSNTEIFRHLDGYSHAGLYRPIPPLRNTVTPGGAGSTDFLLPWEVGEWPQRLRTYGGSEVDIHSLTPKSKSFLDEVRAASARVRLHWGMRICLSSLSVIQTHPSPISKRSTVAAEILFLFSPTGLSNLLDFIALDAVFLTASIALGRISPKVKEWSNGIWYLGATRFLLVKLKTSLLK